MTRLQVFFDVGAILNDVRIGTASPEEAHTKLKAIQHQATREGLDIKLGITLNDLKTMRVVEEDDDYKSSDEDDDYESSFESSDEEC